MDASTRSLEVAVPATPGPRARESSFERGSGRNGAPEVVGAAKPRPTDAARALASPPAGGKVEAKATYVPPSAGHAGRTHFQLGEDLVNATASQPAPTLGEVTVTLKDVFLKKSSDWDGIYHENARTGAGYWLKHAADNELYVVAVAWDLSGREPQVFPLAAEALEGASLVHETYEREYVPGLLDGLQLYRGEAKGGLFVQLFVGESDSSVRSLGEKLKKVNDVVRESGLLEKLAPLAAAEPDAATVALIGQAAVLLADAVGTAMAGNSDDVVSVYQGTIGLDGLAGKRTARYADPGTEITLEVKGALAPAAAKRVAADPPR